MVCYQTLPFMVFYLAYATCPFLAVPQISFFLTLWFDVFYSSIVGSFINNAVKVPLCAMTIKPQFSALDMLIEDNIVYFLVHFWIHFTLKVTSKTTSQSICSFLCSCGHCPWLLIRRAPPKMSAIACNSLTFKVKF